MTGAGKNHLPAIDKAAEETGLTIQQVKKWIGNTQGQLKRKGGPSTANGHDQPKKTLKVPGSRGQSAYNLFCGEYFQSEGSANIEMKQKNSLVAEKWRKLSDGEKQTYKEAANKLKKPLELSSLTEQQKKKMIEVHRKNILKEISFLEDLECETSVIFKDAFGEVYNLGSGSGISFLVSNPEINLKFRQYFACSSSQHFTYKDIQKLFNTKYSEAVQRPGSHVPYLRGGFTVQNLPDGVQFKRPYTYGQKQMKAIMERKEEIKFVVTSEEESAQSRSSLEQANPDVNLLRVLTAVAGQVTAQRVVQNAEKITEEEVEVIDLCLNQDDRLILYGSCRKFFSDDAWLAVGKNLKHDQDAEGVVVPVYTNADDEPFWLFYSTQKLSSVLKSSLNTKIKGYWLDVTDADATRYRLLYTHPDSVLGKNIVKNEHGPFYFTHQMETKEEQYFEMLDSFKIAILNYVSAFISLA